jgi:hypothetical protein
VRLNRTQIFGAILVGLLALAWLLFRFREYL